MPEGAVAPFAAEMEGDWQVAAALWEQIGCPYEQALTLSEGAAAACVRQRMRAGSDGHSPRPTPLDAGQSGRADSREVEVLRLMAEGLSNVQVARRHSTSPKTVDHHVSAILAKLDVHARAQAITAASALGLLSSPT